MTNPTAANVMFTPEFARNRYVAIRKAYQWGLVDLNGVLIMK